jgi:hypothetical protein
VKPTSTAEHNAQREGGVPDDALKPLDSSEALPAGTLVSSASKLHARYQTERAERAWEPWLPPVTVSIDVTFAWTVR